MMNGLVAKEDIIFDKEGFIAKVKEIYEDTKETSENMISIPYGKDTMDIEIVELSKNKVVLSERKHVKIMTVGMTNILYTFRSWDNPAYNGDDDYSDLEKFITPLVKDFTTRKIPNLPGLVGFNMVNFVSNLENRNFKFEGYERFKNDGCNHKDLVFTFNTWNPFTTGYKVNITVDSINNAKKYEEVLKNDENARLVKKFMFVLYFKIQKINTEGTSEVIGMEQNMAKIIRSKFEENMSDKVLTSGTENFNEILDFSELEIYHESGNVYDFMGNAIYINIHPASEGISSPCGIVKYLKGFEYKGSVIEIDLRSLDELTDKDIEVMFDRIIAQFKKSIR